MTRPCLMGINIGTQSIRPALIDLDGRLLASARILQEMYTTRPGWAEQDPEIWWTTTLQNIQKIFSSGDFSLDQVIGIGITNISG